MLSKFSNLYLGSVKLVLFLLLLSLYLDGQIQSLITEVQNIIGQNRETQHSLKETADKVRLL
jgi:hypothetical protein